MDLTLLNEKGLECIRYKEELQKEYPPLVLSALVEKLQTQVKAQLIDMHVFEVLTNSEVSLEDAQAYLLTLPNYIKSTEQLLEEYKQQQAVFSKVLTKHVPYTIQTDIHLPSESLLIYQPFKLSLSFIMSYFGVDKKTAVGLMKKRGFVEKFAVLRLEAIFREFLLTNDFSSTYFSVEKSYVYLDSLTEECGISVLITVPFQFLRSEELHELIAEEMLSVFEAADTFYQKRMGMDKEEAIDGYTDISE